MDSTKAGVLAQLQHKVSLFRVPNFFHFTVGEFHHDKDNILRKVSKMFHSTIVVRSSSIFEDGATVSSAGEFESILNIDSADSSAVLTAVDSVIKSYTHKKADNNQIIIQEMVKGSTMSGVIFTHDLNAGAPYYVINYDDQSGCTDTVTSGNSEYSNRTLYIHRKATNKLHSDRFVNLLEAVQELEKILNSEFLDIEFALGKDLTPYLLQVRPITTKSNWNRSLTKRIDKTLDGVQLFLKDRLKRIDGVYGKTTVLGQMPDWNPAEMIGRAPRALATSLYKAIITDKAWRIAREQMGYSVPIGQPLMVVLAGQPFIDTRLSFHSYLPKTICPVVAEKLVDHWVARLSRSPESHDKIEFDIAITAYSFDMDNRIECLIGDALTVVEKRDFRQAHLIHTRTLIKGECDGSVPIAMAMINALKQKQQLSPPENISSLFAMLDDCITLGTVPFSILARHGFIAKTILLSLENQGVLSNEEVNQLQSSVHTVASELVDDMHSLQSGELKDCAFMRTYGHLRPGTYDIMSQRYDQMKSFTDANAPSPSHKKKRKKFRLSQAQATQINIMLAKDGFGDFKATDLLDYVNDATVGREYGKFVFTRTLSDMVELIGKFAEAHSLSRDEISHIPINTLLATAHHSCENTIEDDLRALSNIELEKHHISSSIRLPQLLIDESGVHVVPFQVSHPNFITKKKVTAPSIALFPGTDAMPLSGRVVIIEGADPGFDWIFSYKIAGLVTKYGGANSHMAIRCAEFGIPAAIGCGEQRFDLILNASQVHLDCAVGFIEPLH